MYLRTEGLFLGVMKSCDVSSAAESLASILGSTLGPLDDDSGFDDIEFVMILEVELSSIPTFQTQTK